MDLQDAIDAGRIEVTISGYGFQGEGFVRLDDGWLSVPSALPGEHVRVDILDRELPVRRRIFGRVCEVLKPSPVRDSSECEDVNRCRGCHLRHAHRDEEKRFKLQSTLEVLEKFAGLTNFEGPSIAYIGPDSLSRTQGYRNRTYLSVEGEAGVEMGMKSRASESLISMSSCPALVQPLRQLVGRVEAVIRDNAGTWLGSGPSSIRGLQISLSNRGHMRVVIDLIADQSWDSQGGAERDDSVGRFARLVAGVLTPQVGLFVRDMTGHSHLQGDPEFRLQYGALDLQVSPPSWYHATDIPAQALYNWVLDSLELEPADRLLDVGSGIGTISLLAAPFVHSFQGLDRDRFSTADAQANQAANGIENGSFRCVGWERGLRDLVGAQSRFEKVTINPMREPVGASSLRYLPALGVQKVVYLGPSMVPAAKDIAVLMSLGFEVTRVGVANLHPATYHAMLCVVLSSKRGDPESFDDPKR